MKNSVLLVLLLSSLISTYATGTLTWNSNSVWVICAGGTASVTADVTGVEDEKINYGITGGIWTNLSPGVYDVTASNPECTSIAGQVIVTGISTVTISPSSPVCVGATVGLTATLSPTNGSAACVAWAGALSGSGLGVSGALTAFGSNTITATCGNQVITVVVIAVGISNVQYSCNGTWYDMATLRMKLGDTLSVRVNPNPSWASFPTGQPIWSGMASATGATATATFNAVSGSDTDLKTVTVTLCSDVRDFPNFLVCNTILGIHSNMKKGDQDATFANGHAWITKHVYSAASTSTIIHYGLWPDGHNAIFGTALDNGSGNDTRVDINQTNFTTGKIAHDPDSGAYNRYFLLSPSEVTSLNTYTAENRTWGYFNNCASFASGAPPGDASASDWWGISTPRKFGKSIYELNSTDPTGLSTPKHHYLKECGGGTTGSTSSETDAPSSTWEDIYGSFDH